MRKTMLWLVAAGALTLGGALTVGCSDESTSERPPIAQLKDGVNLLNVKDPSTMMNAAFVKNSRVVYVQTRIGGPKPDIYRQTSPNEPPNETDMRFVDQHGNTFYAQRGGDNYVDSAWESEVRAGAFPETAVSAEDRDLDFRLAHDAAIALGAALPTTFKDHTFHLSNFAAQPIPSEDPALLAKAQRIAQQPKPDTGYANSFAASRYLETDLYSHQICFAWICPAWHSSTIQWSYTTSWSQAIVACNHGACGGSGNSYQCYSSGGWYSNSTITGETSGSNSTVSGGCLTGYNWDTPPGHECNDDAAYELWQAKNGSMNTQYGGQWNFNHVDSNNNNQACDCNASSNGCSGDWQRPACQ